LADWTVARLLAVTADYLAGKGSSSSRLDAELLLAHALRFERIDLYVQHDRPLTSAEVDAYRELIARRAKHEPVAYILGRASFRYQALEVGPDVLIPRPETEELVDAVLARLRTHPLLETAPSPAAASDVPTPPLIVDVGTGSGAIALSLAAEMGLAVVGIDVSPAAIAVATRNRDAQDLGHLVELRVGDLLEGVPDGSLCLVVSNPPYVSIAEYAGLDPDVRAYEPAGALLAGDDGLDAYRRLLPQAARALRPGGAVLLEVGDGQADRVVALAEAAGLCCPAVTTDLSGKRRIVCAARPGALALPAGTLSDATASTLAAALRAGALIGVPTDTVYGLAAAWDAPSGVRGLFAAKGRGEHNPVAAIFASVAAVRESLPDLDPVAARVVDALLPGPYTFVVATTVSRPSLVGTEESLGVRVPDHPGLLALLASLGTAIAATSANVTGAQAPATLADVDPVLLARCAAVFGAVPGEASVGGVASTVVDLRPLSRGEAPLVLREGAVTAADALARIAAAAAV
jgi:release factor glutamine methyltransferase